MDNIYAELYRNQDIEIRIKKRMTTLLKTSVVEQVAQERGMTYIKLNLAQLEEAGD